MLSQVVESSNEGNGFGPGTFRCLRTGMVCKHNWRGREANERQWSDYGVIHYGVNQTKSIHDEHEKK